MKPALVFLDAGTVDYGDISWKELKALGHFTPHFFSAPDEIKVRAAGVPIVLTNKCRIDRELFEELKGLKCLCVAATGVNTIDLDAAREKNVAVCNVKGYSTETVVQFTIGFILMLAANLHKYNDAVHAGEWSQAQFFMLPKFPVMEVRGKTLGIIGYGDIGKRVAAVARALGMKILISKIPGRRYTAAESRGRESFNRVVAASDFLTIHAPLTKLTQNLINAEVLRKMKPGARLINMARGGIVNEADLRKSLDAGHLSGAACDVLSLEPPPPHHVLMGAANLIMTPHVAWASREARMRLVHEMALNIEAFLKGRKRNRIV